MSLETIASASMGETNLDLRDYNFENGKRFEKGLIYLNFELKPELQKKNLLAWSSRFPSFFSTAASSLSKSYKNDINYA